MLLDQISTQTGLGLKYLTNLVTSAGHRYKVYQIPKRSGGYRTIAHPSRKVKFLQRWIVRNLIAEFPVHPAAAAYQPNASVRGNAEVHVANNFLLKLDFLEFFPSIRDVDVVRHLEVNASRLPFQLSAADRTSVARIVTRQGAIPIGAPSSPLLSNQIMYEFDLRLASLCEARGVSFTRYADDLFLSTNEPNVLSGVHREVIALLGQISKPRLNLNQSKTVYTSRRRRRVVTGVVLTSDRRISLGREQKRYIRGLMHKALAGQLPEDKTQYLIGYLAYAQSVEPSFVEALRTKYGEKLVSNLSL